MAFKEDTNAPLILTIGAISGFLVIVTVIGLQAWYMSEVRQEHDDKFANAVNYQLDDLRAEQTAHLNTYRWIDQKNHVAAIPLEAAKKLLIENHGKLPTTQPAK